MIYESAGAARATSRRENPPGMHLRRRRPSNYGLALMEKQKIKHYYGVSEKQLRRYFAKASSSKGNTGERLLLICESRLDNVIRRVGLCKTRPQARQAVSHGHFKVNGVKVDKASFAVRPGDVISVRNNERLRSRYQLVVSEGNAGEGLDWVNFDAETLTATVAGAPSGADISLPVDANTVVEFMSR
jgi:small subunit ribosomal protein S4